MRSLLPRERGRARLPGPSRSCLPYTTARLLRQRSRLGSERFCFCLPQIGAPSAARYYDLHVFAVCSLLPYPHRREFWEQWKYTLYVFAPGAILMLLYFRFSYAEEIV